MDILFSGATIVTMDQGMQILFSGYLGVTGEKIAYLGQEPPKDTPEKIIDATGMVLMPGLINCHTHLATGLLRGAAEDMGQAQWLEDGVFPRTDRLDARAARAGVLLSLAECIRFGVTSVSDLYGFAQVTAETVAEVGLKANIAPPLSLFAHESEEFDFETDPACQAFRALAEKWNGYDNGRIRIDAGLDGEYTGSYRLWEPLAAYAREKNLGIQLHLAESRAEAESCLDRTGLTPAQLLDCHGVFFPGACAAGCGGLEPEDLALLGRRGISAVCCPVSNLKFALPPAPVTELVKAGMNVALGTDSAAANNTLDMFEEMKAVALAEKRRTGHPAALPAEATLMMATVCGARAQGRQAQCGMLKVGMDADLILVAFTAPHLMPCHNVLSSLVYAARGSDVALTMVQGKILYAGGKFTTIQLDQVVKELAGYAMEKLFAPAPEN